MTTLTQLGQLCFKMKMGLGLRVVIMKLKKEARFMSLTLKKKCQTFSQLVKYTKKSPGTVSLYKNKMLADKIIVGSTNACKCHKKYDMKIKYRLSDPEKVRTLVLEYGKTSLTKSADNLADVFLSLR